MNTGRDHPLLPSDVVREDVPDGIEVVAFGRPDLPQDRLVGRCLTQRGCERTARAGANEIVVPGAGYQRRHWAEGSERTAYLLENFREPGEFVHLALLS